MNTVDAGDLAQGQKTVEKFGPAFLFDLDGTLVDSVYQHVLAWREALEVAGIELAVWRIHRRIGMSGGLFVNALLRETGQELGAEEVMRLQRLHEDVYLRLANLARPLPGAVDLLAHFSAIGVPWAVATSGRMRSARPALDMLGVPPATPVITRDQVSHAKPDPDLFLAAADQLEWKSLIQSWLVTVFGICWRPAGPERWEWAFFQAVMVRMSLNAPERTASTRILQT